MELEPKDLSDKHAEIEDGVFEVVEKPAEEIKPQIPKPAPLKLIVSEENLLELGEIIPADDITAKEAVHLAIFILVSAFKSQREIDFISYIEHHGLSRHFKKDVPHGTSEYK